MYLLSHVFRGQSILSKQSDYRPYKYESTYSIRGYMHTNSRTMLSLSVLLLTLVLLDSRLLISAETVVTCDGFVQRLSCDSGVISVQSATFGRTSSQICSIGRPQSETSNTQCSIDVPAVSKQCDGLRECELNTQGLAGQDPCYGTYKYYTTNYICIQAEISVTCHGGYGYLKCDNGKIQINTANYGRTDKITCSEGRPSSELQNTKCYFPNALATVSKSCNGLKSCEIFATHTVFTDPCVGIYKYLAISYFCFPPEIRSSLVCEQETNYLKCEVGTAIHIHSASYGRTDSGTCSTGRPASQLAKTDCYALNSQTVVANGCEGKNSCSILASNGVFSDPCVGTFKYLYISYSCSSKIR
ncbi:rhamnose-binding lectin-like [Siphateles boraxobius]|uniref:rhamnose-binding lectin-like n=1 Tax=Siphateles boraxobius TaxID=180520 RepID=UPI00406405FB